MRGRKKKALRALLMAISSLSVLAALGCGTYSPVAPSNDTLLMPGLEDPSFVTLLPASKDDVLLMQTSAASAVISAANGGVISNGYFTLTFAPGALEQDTEITMEMPDFPAAKVRLGPHGIQFKAEVILSLPLSVVLDVEGEQDVAWHNEATGLWESIGKYIDGDCVKATLEHFSDYAYVNNLKSNS